MQRKKSYIATKSEIKPNWYYFDASEYTLGRLSTKIATILMGKHKPEYVHYLNSGDKVVVVNTKDIKVTGNKETDKIYYRHTGNIQGFREEPLNYLREHRPNKIMENAVKGMLPKNRLRDARMKNLILFQDDKHTHTAQEKYFIKDK